MLPSSARSEHSIDHALPAGAASTVHATQPRLEWYSVSANCTG